MRAGFLLLIAALAATPAQAQARAPSPLPAGPLTLAQAIALGRSRGVQARIAELGARIAEDRIGQRRADLLPSIGAGASYTRQTVNLDEFGLDLGGFTGVTDPFNIYRLQLRASQSLIDPAAWARLSAARDSAAAAGLDARNAGALAGAAAGVAWLRLLAAEETVRARVADSAVAGSLLEQSRRLLEAGVTAAIDLTRSGVAFGAVRSQLAVARNQRDRARLDLARALDLPPAGAIVLAELDGPDGEGVPESQDSAVTYALAHRPDLAAERKRLEVLGLGRRAIRAEQLPSLAASGSWQESGPRTGQLKSSWTVQVGLNIPIIDGFRRQYRSQEQAVRIESEAHRLEDLANQVESDARQAVLDLASAREQVAIASDRQRLSAEELRQAEERFEAGVAGSLETSNAQLSLTAARDAVIQAKVAVGVARVAAMRALGVI